MDDCGLPGHLPVKVQVSLAALRTLYNQPIKPKDFTADQLCLLPAPQEEQLAQSCFHSFADNWDSAFQASDPNRLWQYWNSFTEDFLCKRANISQPVKYSGRGHFPKFVQLWALAPKERNKLIRMVHGNTVRQQDHPRFHLCVANTNGLSAEGRWDLNRCQAFTALIEPIAPPLCKHPCPMWPGISTFIGERLSSKDPQGRGRGPD